MLLRLRRLRLTRRRAVAGSVAIAAIAALTGWAAWPDPGQFATSDQFITVLTGPAGDESVTLDTTLYLPRAASAAHPVPAVLLAHGFGGTKNSVAADAADLANLGYAVLAWSAEGFGRSGGQIHLDSPDYEVRDAQRLLDWLAARPEIRTDAPGDPRVAAVGGSYGGGLALLLAGHDRRVDAIVPTITWNDLAHAFLPESTGADPRDGVFKRQWAGLFFGAGGGGAGGAGAGGGLGALAGAAAGDSAGNAGGAGGPDPTRLDPTRPDPMCGRFAADTCAAYLDLATATATTTATAPSDATLALLHRSSPASVLDAITAPTLLIQGQADTLFPLSEAEANYRGIAAHGTKVRVDWFAGGHDGGAGPPADQDRGRALTARWLDFHLRGQGADPGTGFTFSRLAGFDADTRRITTVGFSAATSPAGAATGATRTVSVSVSGPPQQIANPPNGTPAAISSLPGAGSSGLSSLLNSAALEISGQHADFLSAPLTSTVDVVGAPTVTIRAASPTGTAVAFVKLYDTDPSAGSSLPFGLVAPIRLTGLPRTLDAARPITITLPVIVHKFEAGHRLRLTVSSADQAYATPPEPTRYVIGVPEGGAPVTLPGLDATPIANPESIWRYVLAALVVVLLAVIGTAVAISLVRRRRSATPHPSDESEAPLVVTDLGKEYADGFVAVSRVDFTVERGQVVGLLGPNGAGKTTTLRVLLGLTRPSRGEVRLFGRPLTPGSDTLTRVGALVEGPGFLPHATGLANLRLYWRATGRPADDAHFDEVLEIAGLDDAVHRKVRTYSHGMKQRLAIAQAMLGLPELLILDEPTDGLDPPQIAQMRTVLHRYATAERAVLVSSHLLAEVEQTCTHAVVMHKGLVVANGPVDEIVGESAVTRFDVTDTALAAQVLAQVPGVRSVEADGDTGLVVDLAGEHRPAAIAALVHAGVDVDRVAPRRRLEDAFLTLVGGDTKGSGQR